MEPEKEEHLEKKPEEKFNLMSLPFVAFRKVMYQAEFFTILNLSLVSKRSHAQVRSCALQVTDVELNLKKSFSNELNVMFKGEKYSWGVIETVNANNAGVFVNPRNDMRFKPICSRILGILHKKSVDTFRFDRSITLEDINEYWDMIEEAKNIYIASDMLTRPEMDMVLEKFQKVNSLFVDPALPLFYQGFTNRKFEILYLEGPNAITLPDFMKIDTDILLMQVSRFENWELNIFLKKWMELPKTPGKLDPRVIRIFNSSGDISMLQDIKTYPWDPRHRSEYYVIYLDNGVMAIDCSKGFDLVRGDGRIATVLIRETSFDFLVWEHQFHDVPRNAILC
ncbi:hypothetical protein CRE_13283 [Caenorhabditis remanei]|uniref:F-box domain-containing protein n=1 Tax=Caenorhabditis remanei TaxID=31234 RepID=E3M8H5_CAERE|nr:hypothetical protein CRE_13283 [Caenorhabditis remanei]